MEKKDVRIQLVISQSEIDALDAWRAVNRIWSRSAAIRQLIAEGIGGKAAENDGPARRDILSMWNKAKATNEE